MPYSNDVVYQAKEKLNERRNAALDAADIRKETLFARHPRLAEIESELNTVGASTARAVLAGKNAGEFLNSLREKSLALQKEQDEILASFGLTPDYLEPRYFCEKCSDTGYVEADNKTVICDCFKTLLSDTACEALNAVSPLELSTFESFNIDLYSDRTDKNGRVPFKHMSRVYNYCRDYADNFSLHSRSLLMQGATGLGKTHLSLAIAHELLEKGFSVVYVSAPDILSKIEREHFSRDVSDTDTLNSLKSCDLLIIDDLGTEFATPFTASAIYNIFNNRVLTSKPVIISTNLSLSELEQSYSQRFISRVMGSCDRLDFIGSDVRPKLK